MNGGCYGFDSAYKSGFIASLYENATLGGDVFTNATNSSANHR